METHVGQGVGIYIQKELFSASKQILISTPLISYSLGEKLIDISKRGINIKILTSETDVINYKNTIDLLRKFSRDKKSHTIEKNDSLFEIKVVSLQDVALIHAKIYVIDDICAITGSANLTEDSFFNYPEYVIIDKESNNIHQVKRDFQNLWDTYSDMSTKTSLTNRKIRRLIWNIRSKL